VSKKQNILLNTENKRIIGVLTRFEKKNPVLDSASLQSAVQCVKEKKVDWARIAAITYNIPASTVQSYLKRVSLQK
jgi:hypothetical protein